MLECPFDVVVITAPTERSARAYQRELEARLRPRLGAGVELLSIHDPEGRRIGSGGGTLNGLAHVKRTLVARGMSVGESRIVMIHSGGDSQRSPTNSVCGKAWSALNSVDEYGRSCNTPIDLLLKQLCTLFMGTPEGSMVVASSDVMLLLPPNSIDLRQWWTSGSKGGVTGLAIMAPLALGPNHGVYVTEGGVSSHAGQRVTTYLQKASVSELEAKGAVCSPTGQEATTSPQVAIDTGVVFFSPEATEVLVGLLEEDLFKSCCTCTGEEGAMDHTTSITPTTALRLELYSDILLALSGGVGQSYEAYLRMDGNPSPQLLQARERLWHGFASMPFYTVTPPEARFAHLGTTEELMEMMTMKMRAFSDAYNLQAHACCDIGPRVVVASGGVVLNSVADGIGTVATGAVVEHCVLRGGGWEVGAGSLCSGLYFAGENVRVRPDFCVQETRLSPSSGDRVTGPQPPPPPPSFSSSLSLRPQPYVLVILAVQDSIKAHYQDVKATVWGCPWATIFRSLGVSPDEIWASSVPHSARNLWTARLFPVLDISREDEEPKEEHRAQLEAVWWMQDMKSQEPPTSAVVDRWRRSERLSLSAILCRAEPGKEFEWRRAVEREVERRRVWREQALSKLKKAVETKPYPGCLPLEDLCKATGAAPGWLIERLEGWASTEPLPLSVMSVLWALLARLFTDVANGIEAATPQQQQQSPHQQNRVSGAVSSSLSRPVGSTSNEAVEDDERWLKLMVGLESHHSSHDDSNNNNRHVSNNQQPHHHQRVDYRQVARGLSEIRRGWTGFLGCRGVRPCVAGQERCLLAAWHYEKACHAIIKTETATAAVGVSAREVEPIRMGQVVVAEAAARIDLAGGWSDTPPISWEMGGEVANVAILINGQRPIGAKVRLIESPQIVFLSENMCGATTETRCTCLSDLLDYSDPMAKAALLKCAVLYCGLLSLDSPLSLPDQLTARLGGGLEVRSWSRLPTGSGLGTSSILVGTVLAAVGRAVGREYDDGSLNHAVLQLEQMMSTGGGWQDQVGGLVGGVKMGRSAASLPLRVEFDRVELTPVMREKIEEHLLLIYTGKQRLARDLLQSVLRRYYGRVCHVVETVRDLVTNAREAIKAVQDEDMVALGSGLSQYWEQKKVMAGGAKVCEPPHVTTLMKALAPLVHGMSLCGAGGGGFMVVVTKDPLSRPNTIETLEAVVEGALCSGHDVEKARLSHAFPIISPIRVDEEGMVMRVM